MERLLTLRWRVALAVLVVVVALVGGVLVVLRAPAGNDVAGSLDPSASPTTGDDAPSATPSISPTTPADPIPTAGPPAGTVHVDDRRRARYGGRHLGWDDLLDRGTKLPAVSAGCRSDWKTTSRDDALSWKKASFLCLDQLTGNGFHPQGIGGSGSTVGYRIGGRDAGERNIVLVSSYSSEAEAGLRFPHRPGRTDTTRLTVIDIDRRVFTHVELVRPVGPDSFTALDSHGSGVAWAGQYLYSSSRGSLWMFNADDLMEIDGRFVLPAVARWSVQGRGGLSSIGVDRSTRPATLTGINYSETGTAWSHSFTLTADGRVRNGATTGEHQLDLIRGFGPGSAAIRSSRSAVVQGTNFQGIGASGPYRFVNSSSLMLDGKRHGDNVVVLKKNKAIARFSLPRENVESVYVDYRRKRYVTVTEHGRQFLFSLPIEHLIDRAER
ncbi:MAG TPA: hypothetical protein VIT41_18080 [Microlunatus sp.]